MISRRAAKTQRKNVVNAVRFRMSFSCLLCVFAALREILCSSLVPSCALGGELPYFFPCISAATFSASFSTRITLPPSTFLMSAAVCPRVSSSCVMYG